MKESLKRLYDQRGITISEAARQMFEHELTRTQSASSQLDAILESAAQKLESTGLPSPSIEEITAYIEKVRAERLADAKGA
jgi:hypothetical protein